MARDSALRLDAPLAARSPAVRRLTLHDFRSYAAVDLHINARLIALTGENGAGKTNLLEALSLLAPGRGLRRAELGECARDIGGGGWAVSVELADAGTTTQLGTGIEPPSLDAAAGRKCRIERAPVASASAFADHVRAVWLTPAMDQLFNGPPGDRRRFLDRLVLAVDATHGARVNALERALRNRNRLLEEGVRDTRWLDAAEHEAAGLAIALAAARAETVSRLAALIARERDDASPFPHAEITLNGEVDTLVAAEPARVAEERYCALLRDNRGRDAAARRTLIGPHTSDLMVLHGPKDTKAQRCSTGEQKALLTGLVLAHARLVAEMSGIAPLVLLDEIAAHFDARHRSALYASLEGLGAQVWMTGADPSAFAGAQDRALMLKVTHGRVEPLGAV